MSLDVIDAAAEALPLELLNPTNKELTAQLSHYEQLFESRRSDIDDQRKRLQFMKEHLGNVRVEIVNTQSLSASKQRELDSEEHMYRLLDRECGRLRQKQSQLATVQTSTQDEVATTQNRLFVGNVQMEEFKKAMNFNQEELEQWNVARRQKEEDELAIAQYTKIDEGKIKRLNAHIEKLERQLRTSKETLAEEVINTQNAQKELDTCAFDYRKLHDDRSGLLAQWEEVVKAIYARDNAIRAAAEQYADGAEWLQNRKLVVKELSDEVDAVKAEGVQLNVDIKARERDAERGRSTHSRLEVQVREMDEEVDTLRELMSGSVNRRNDAMGRLREAKERVVQKKVEVEQYAARREEAALRVQAEKDAASDLSEQTALIAKLWAEAQAAGKQTEQEVEQLKKTQFAANEKLNAARRKQRDYIADISGAQATGKTLKARIAQLDGESFAQQEVLYNIEFSVQQMEKKVNRALGERTEEERSELHEKIAVLQSSLDDLGKQQRVMEVQVKRARDELRQAKYELERQVAQKGRDDTTSLELQLQCDSCAQELQRLEKEKEDALVRCDTQELQLQRLKKELVQRSSELYSLEEEKRALAADVSERQAEIGIHHEMLTMEAKVAEEERRRLAGELLSRQKELAAIKNRHAVMVGRMDPEQARLSQTQLIIDTAKEREELQYRGDSLDSRIKRLERDMLKLERTLAILRASNATYRHKFDKVSPADEEAQTQKALKEKYRELNTIVSRRTFETNDYTETLQKKSEEQEQLEMAKNQLEVTLAQLNEEYRQVHEEMLQTKETVIRYDHAIEKAQQAVPAEVAKEIELFVSQSRLALTMHRVVEVARRASGEVGQEAEQLFNTYQIPFERTVMS